MGGGEKSIDFIDIFGERSKIERDMPDSAINYILLPSIIIVCIRVR